jgi:16S rRNA (adenine1518-N6/adenine1519-N6)-dimethyltransferase
LIDQAILRKIAGYANLDLSDRVLEIGPGSGNLTQFLSEMAGKVYAVELDPSLAADLPGRWKNVEIICGDAMVVDLPDYNKVVSNLPYQISTGIMRRLLFRPFDLLVLTVQREFAFRLIARPGTPKYGRMAMVAAHYAEIEVLEVIPRSAFDPQPNVSSVIVRLTPRRDRIPANDAIYDELTNVFFTMRRKKVKASLAAMGLKTQHLPTTSDRFDKSLLEMRPEELSSEDAASIAIFVEKLRSRQQR